MFEENVGEEMVRQTVSPPKLASVALAVPLVAGLASWLPARRAAAVDPVIAISVD